MRRNPRKRTSQSKKGAKGFTLLQKIQLALISNFGWFVIKLIGPTLRYKVDSHNYFIHGPRPAIYTFWHNQIVCAVYKYRNENIVVLTSQHFDGEYIARIIESFGYLAARGSSTRGAVRGLLELKTYISNGRDVAFTIDGPKGPKYKVKPGPLFLSQKTGLPVIPFHVEPNRFWELKSWDRLRIPKPFARMVVKIGTPLYVPEEYDEEEYLGKLQHKMDELIREGEDYFKRYSDSDVRS